MANVGVKDGVNVSVGRGVLVGKSVGVEVVVGVIGVDDSMMGVATAGADGGETSVGAQETNIHAKQIPIHNRFCMAYILLTIQCGINGPLKNGIRLCAVYC